MPIPEIKPQNHPKTAKERIYSAVKEWIIDGTLAPGEKIFDKDIAEYFSVSRTPVREAFQMLAEQRLITISPGKESRVSIIDPVAVRQSYEILAVLEPLAVKYAVAQMTDSAIAHLRDSVVQFRKAVTSGDAKAACMADRCFHEIILRTAQNEFLLQFSRTIQMHIIRIENNFFSQQDISELLSSSVNEHELILEAIEKKDVGEAQRLIADNWLHTIAFADNLPN